jgi:hypothetical protein
VVVHVAAVGPSSSWQNLDFELDAAPADGQPDGWQLKTNAATDVVDCTTASSGSCSFLFVGNKKAKKIFQAWWIQPAGRTSPLRQGGRRHRREGEADDHVRQRDQAGTQLTLAEGPS